MFIKLLFAWISFLILVSINKANAQVACDVAMQKNSGAANAQQSFQRLREELAQEVIGQSELIEKVLISVLANGHILVEGPTGTAKTRTIESLSKLVRSEYKRVQFTIATEPTELTGAEVYNHAQNKYEFKQGTLFSNFVLADEINRASPKTQSALLQAMEEKAITVAGQRHELSDVYLVMATQNPIEQAGTFALPEAQMDRFLMKVKVQHPDMQTESQILDLVLKEKLDPSSRRKLTPVMGLEEIRAGRAALLKIQSSENVRNYITNLVMATRNPLSYSNKLGGLIAEGAGTRGTISLELAARARAWLRGSDRVEIADVDAIAKDVLRHRIKLSEMALNENLDVDKVIVDLSAAVKAKLGHN